MRTRVLLCLAIAATVFAAPAAAVELGELAPGYTIYNRSGADLRAHNQDFGACVQRMQPAGTPDPELAKHPWKKGIFWEFMWGPPFQAFKPGVLKIA